MWPELHPDGADPNKDPQTRHLRLDQLLPRVLIFRRRRRISGFRLWAVCDQDLLNGQDAADCSKGAHRA